MPYHELSTAKYWNETVKQEYKAWRRQKNRDAVASFGVFLFTLAVIGCTYYAVQTMPGWLPVAVEWFELAKVQMQSFTG